MTTRPSSAGTSLTRRQGMPMLASVTLGVAVASRLSAAGVAAVLPGSAHHTTAASTTRTPVGDEPGRFIIWFHLVFFIVIAGFLVIGFFVVVGFGGGMSRPCARSWPKPAASWPMMAHAG